MALDGTGWDVANPEDDDYIPAGPSEIRDLRLGVELRLNKEHVTLAADGNGGTGGEHEEGSAKAYHESAEPTTRPDSVALDADDNGRLWFDPDNHQLAVYEHDGTWDVIPKVVAANALEHAAGGLQIKAKGVDTGQIADGAVEALQLNTDAVETTRIKDANVTLAKLAADSVDKTKLAPPPLATDATNAGIPLIASGSYTGNGSGSSREFVIFPANTQILSLVIRNDSGDVSAVESIKTSTTDKNWIQSTGGIQAGLALGSNTFTTTTSGETLNKLNDTYKFFASGVWSASA